MNRLDPRNINDYLLGQGIGEQGATWSIEPLGGGVSNLVFRAQRPGDCLVLKQPLAKLDVEDDWPADPDRVHNEATAARTYQRIIQASGIEDIRVPAIRFEDRSDHVIGMECAPEEASMWKRMLLQRQVEPDIGANLGRMLGRVHSRTAFTGWGRDEFSSQQPFIQLRIDPYHRTTAERHPEVAGPIHREVERILKVHRCLVHGDYSPKNILVERRADGHRRLWILDFEVAHWGDPAFDAAFMMNHLFIKSIYRFPNRESYLETASAFWRAYQEEIQWELESSVVTELCILMLARVDGKSPVEYIETGPVAETLREIALNGIDTSIHRLDQLDSLVRSLGEARLG